MSNLARDEFHDSTSKKVTPFHQVQQSSRESMQDQNQDQDQDHGSDLLEQLNAMESQSTKIAEPTTKARNSSLVMTLVKGLGLLILLVGLLGGTHFYLNSDSGAAKKEVANNKQNVEKQVSQISANIAAIDTDSSNTTEVGNQSNELAETKPVQNQVQLPEPVTSKLNAPLEFSDPNSIEISEAELEQANTDPYVAALQAMGSNQEQAVVESQKTIPIATVEQNQPKIVDVLGDVDLKSLLDKHIRMVDASISAQEVKIEGTQKAVTQTAQLVVALTSSMQSLKKDVVGLRSIAYENQDSIKALEEKAKDIEKKILEYRGSTSQVTKAVSSPVTSKPTNAPQVQISNNLKTGTQSVNAQSATTQATNIQSQSLRAKPAIELSNFTVNATVNDRAAISHKDGRTFPLVRGERYSNLGRVVEFDPVTNDVYGEFDNGKAWVIRGSK